MSDQRLRELERAFLASGALADEVAFLREAARVGRAGAAGLRTHWAGRRASITVSATHVEWGAGGSHWSESGGGGRHPLRAFVGEPGLRQRLSAFFGEDVLDEATAAARAVLEGRLLAPERLAALEAKPGSDPAEPPRAWRDRP